MDYMARFITLSRRTSAGISSLGAPAEDEVMRNCSPRSRSDAVVRALFVGVVKAFEKEHEEWTKTQRDGVNILTSDSEI